MEAVDLLVHWGGGWNDREGGRHHNNTVTDTPLDDASVDDSYVCDTKT